ncbi:MAG: hypothetical protein ABIP94_17470 [Planctomycetota bacterium]
MAKSSPNTRLGAAQRREQVLTTTLPVFARFGFAALLTRALVPR